MRKKVAESVSDRRESSPGNRERSSPKEEKIQERLREKKKP